MQLKKSFHAILTPKTLQPFPSMLRNKTKYLAKADRPSVLRALTVLTSPPTLPPECHPAFLPQHFCMCSFPKQHLSRCFHGWLRSLFRTQHKCHLLGEDFSVHLPQIHPASILFAVLFSAEHSALAETILLFDYLPPLSVGSGSVYLTHCHIPSSENRPSAAWHSICWLHEDRSRCIKSRGKHRGRRNELELG